jgi:hypothetical protein
MSDKTAKMLERVRALLAKADSTDFPEEAAAFRAKADELMTAYAIDQFMVDQAQRGLNQTVRPERRDFTPTWIGSRFRDDLYTMFWAVAEHCRCVVGSRGYTHRSIPVYGLPSDLDYLDLLFTNLNLEVAKNMDPPVDPAGEVGHEVFKQRQAGISWPRITEKMYKAGLVKLTKAERAKLDRLDRLYADERPDEITWDYLKHWDWDRTGRSELGEVRTSMKNRLANANRRYVKDHGLEQERNYVKPEVYQRSFMYGFRQEIRDRIWDLQLRNRKRYDEQHQSSEFALAVRDIKQMAVELYEQDYPPPAPIKVDPNAKPVKSRRRMPAVREVRIDHGAIAKGREAGAKADLSNQPGRRVGGDKGSLNR